MGNYISKFDTTAEFEAFSGTNDCKLPHVSLTKDNCEVHYIDHPYVEIDGIKWATYNVGATGVTDYGIYFQWGDTSGYTASQIGSGSGKKYFGWADYKYYTSDTGSGSSGMTKYNSTDGKTVLDTSDDAVIANWGGKWRIPSYTEFNALLDATTSEFISGYQGTDVGGILFTDKTDNSKVLFFPAVGECLNGASQSGLGAYGIYWTASLYGSDYTKAYRFVTHRDNSNYTGGILRYRGHAIRAIKEN